MKITHNVVIRLEEIAELLNWDMTEIEAARRENRGGAVVDPTHKMIKAFLKSWKTFGPFAAELQKLMKKGTLASVQLLEWDSDWKIYTTLKINGQNLEL